MASPLVRYARWTLSVLSLTRACVMVQGLDYEHFPVSLSDYMRNV